MKNKLECNFHSLITTMAITMMQILKVEQIHLNKNNYVIHYTHVIKMLNLKLYD